MSPGSLNPDYSVDINPFPVCLRWLRTSPTVLLEAEERLLKRLKSSLESSFVPIFQGTCYIRTLIARNHRDKEATDEPCVFANKESSMPIVMVHGFASGSALWCKNLDSFAAHRSVYTFDLLGFGRSSRPSFPEDPKEAEKKFVDSVEEWRKALNLEKFILLGHSLGGFIASSYAISHPERVAHLVLVDPWGFFGLPVEEEVAMKNSRKPWLFKIVKNTNPLALLRAVGPIGRRLIQHVRQDLCFIFDERHLLLGESIEVPQESEESALQKGAFLQQTTDSEQPFDTPDSLSKGLRASFATNENTVKSKLDPTDLDGSVALDYIYQINVQRPSGEIGFKAMCSFVGFAKHPMVLRMGDLDPHVPITFIYGSRSWLDISSGVKTRSVRPGSYVDIKVIEGAGHQVYAEAAEEFNSYVNAVAEHVDRGAACNPVFLGDHEQQYVKLNSVDASLSTNKPTGADEQKPYRKRSVASTHKLASGRLEDPERSLTTAASNHRLGHEASDEASD